MRRGEEQQSAIEIAIDLIDFVQFLNQTYAQQVNAHKLYSFFLNLFCPQIKWIKNQMEISTKRMEMRERKWDREQME